MAVSAITTQNVPSMEDKRSPTSVLGKDDFLNLLVAQLKHQDPLKPMESTEFTAQLAQFSSLEQLYNVNDNLGNLENSQAAMHNNQAVSMIGKTAWARGNIVQKTDAASPDLYFGLDRDASETMVYIYDARGNFIKTIAAGAREAGSHSISWNGTNDEGSPVPDGPYQFEVLAGDAQGNTVSSETFVVGLVSGVTFDQGTAHLQVNDLSIPMQAVVRVADTDSTNNSDNSMQTYFNNSGR
jgi:flagellar basal-body rod modification protein FlgD